MLEEPTSKMSRRLSRATSAALGTLPIR